MFDPLNPHIFWSHLKCYFIVFCAIAMIGCVISIIYPLAVFLDVASAGLAKSHIDMAFRSAALWVQLLLTHPSDAYVQGSIYALTLLQTNQTAAYSALSVTTFLLVATLMTIRNSLGRIDFNPTHLGDSEWATLKDLKSRGETNDHGVPLARFPGFWKACIGTFIRMPETLSAIVMAPPGTGKTVNIIGSILAGSADRGTRASTPTPSYVINDPKGEIYAATAGYRSTLGPVIHIDWNRPEGVSFNPLAFGNFRNGPRIPMTRFRLERALSHLYADPRNAAAQLMTVSQQLNDWQSPFFDDPSFTPIVRHLTSMGVDCSCFKTISTFHSFAESQELWIEICDLVVELGACYVELEGHAQRMAQVACPDSSGGMDKYWTEGGRQAVLTFMLLEMVRYERSQIDAFWAEHNQETAQPVREPTISRMLEFLAGASLNAANDKPEGEDEEIDADKFSALLEEALKESKRNGYPLRLVTEIGTLLGKNVKERGSFVSTGTSSLNIFKSSAIKARTSRSDFTVSDLRGKTIEGVNRPITIYVAIDLQNAEVVGVPTGLLVEAAAKFLISQSDPVAKTRPVVFLLDEFWTLPKLSSLLEIPALGRGKWVQLVAIGQSQSQIALKYGREALEIALNAFTYLVTFTTSDLKEAEALSKTFGSKTVKQKSRSESGLMQSMAKGEFFGSGSVNTSFTAQPLIRPDQLLSLPKMNPKPGSFSWGEVLISASGSRNRPTKAAPIMWFKHRSLRRRGYLNKPGFVKGPANEGETVYLRDWGI